MAAKDLKGWPAACFGTMILLAAGVAVYAYGFQLRAFGSTSFHQHFDEMPVAGAMHIVGGATVLLIGGFQFWGGLRRRRPGLHRLTGKVYLALVAVGGLGGLMLAPFATGGLVARFGFGLLAVLWLYSAWQAWAAIRRRDIQTHREWMLRNFSMTFGAVTLRLYLGLFLGPLGLPFSEVYPTVAWISWVPNLILVEWYLAAERSRQQTARTSALNATT